MEHTMVNADPIEEGEATYGRGDRVTMTEDAEMYPGEDVIVLASGRGRGPFFGGRVIYDIVPAETVDAAGGLDAMTFDPDGDDDHGVWRVIADQIEGA